MVITVQSADFTVARETAGPPGVVGAGPEGFPGLVGGTDGQAELQETPVPDGQDGVGQLGLDHHLSVFDGKITQ